MCYLPSQTLAALKLLFESLVTKLDGGGRGDEGEGERRGLEYARYAKLSLHPPFRIETSPNPDQHQHFDSGAPDFGGRGCGLFGIRSCFSTSVAVSTTPSHAHGSTGTRWNMRDVERKLPRAPGEEAFRHKLAM